MPNDAGFVDASVHGPTPTANRGCKVDPAAEQACVARGSDFAYGPAPFIYCSGAAVNTGALAERHAHVQENSPCACNNLPALQQRRAKCSMVPSARGR